MAIRDFSSAPNATRHRPTLPRYESDMYFQDRMDMFIHCHNNNTKLNCFSFRLNFLGNRGAPYLSCHKPRRILLLNSSESDYVSITCNTKTLVNLSIYVIAAYRDVRVSKNSNPLLWIPFCGIDLHTSAGALTFWFMPNGFAWNNRDLCRSLF